ncbi:DUF6343 family protein [Jiangella endophytica]|uniref:DUF6343 family protein n=1 Tax=Jiangella endophytica TaxID=1623398 RepID=UPI000E357D11|nr:DUF6343 family protein [Jiangella endophytica]
MNRPGSRAHEPTGREPAEARSAYGLRLAFALVGLVLGTAGMLVFGPGAADDDGAARVWWLMLSALFAVTAAVDIVVIARRRRRDH